MRFIFIFMVILSIGCAGFGHPVVGVSCGPTSIADWIEYARHTDQPLRVVGAESAWSESLHLALEVYDEEYGWLPVTRTTGRDGVTLLGAAPAHMRDYRMPPIRVFYSIEDAFEFVRGE